MRLLSTTRALLTLAVLALLSTACLQDDSVVSYQHYSEQEFQVISQSLNLPVERDHYGVQMAEHMLRAGAQPPTLNDAKATLGRVLFYDTKLSQNNSVSCASCHHQDLAFSDNKALSEGFDGGLTKRNSLALAATANFSSSYGDGGPNGGPVVDIIGFPGGSIGFFWDERAGTIAHQSSLTIEDPIEMGMNLNELTAKLAQEEYYRILFQKAYGDELVSADRITDALQEFVNSFVSVGSRFDEGLNNVPSPQVSFANFTSQENLGKDLFQANCASCHGADMTFPSGMNMANNGLDLVYEDKGLGEHTGLEENFGIFKIPFLRNVALTGPYMHDGRFATLEEVVDHYSSGIQAHENLSPQLREVNGQPLRMNFTDEEKAALVAFLETLTDPGFAQDVRYSDPFR
ncbi:MAG: c-type cytochrome [Lewinella sp.]|nr:c-type cytochrome [Lewinella sp.]